MSPLDHAEGQQVYLDASRITLHNNAAERHSRGPEILRYTTLGFGCPERVEIAGLSSRRPGPCRNQA